MARQRSREDGRERDREDVANDGTRGDLAVTQGDLNVSETAHGTDRRLRFKEDFLPDFLDMEFTDGVMPVLSMQLEHDGSGFVVSEAGGSAGEAAGFLTNTSTSSTSFQQVDVYTVSSGTTGRLEEVAATGSGNAEVRFTVDGTTFGPAPASDSPSFGLDGSTLPGGREVEVEVKSTDGNAADVTAQVISREV